MRSPLIESAIKELDTLVDTLVININEYTIDGENWYSLTYENLMSDINANQWRK